MKDNLTNPSQLCAKYKVGKERMDQMLSTVEPVLVMPFGRGTMRLYDPAKAHARIETVLAEEAAQRAAAAKPTPVQAPDAPPFDLLPVITQLNTLTQLVANLTTEVSRLRADALGRLDVIALKAELDAIVVDKADDAPAVLDGTVKQPAPAAQPSKPEKIKLALVAVPAGMASRLHQQFGDVFDLKFLDSKDAVGNSFSQRVGDAQFVIGMLDFMNHGISGIERNASYTYIPLKGGQSKLVDKLNELFAQVTEPA